MNRIIPALFLALCAGLAPAVPVRFAADVTKAQTHQATAYRGETLEIEAALFDAGRPLTNSAPAALYWQTNGMATAWWTAPAAMSGGVIRATWSPTNDVGAAAYRVFLGVTDGGRNYRANMTLRMTGSPGDSPNALPLPTPVLDFAAVSVTNAPWALPYAAGDNIVITNGVISSTASGGGGGGEAWTAATNAQSIARDATLVARARSIDVPWKIVKAEGHEEYEVSVDWFYEGEMNEGWGWLVRDNGCYTLPDGGENHDPLATHLTCAGIIETADRPIYYSPSGAPAKVLPSAELVDEALAGVADEADLAPLAPRSWVIDIIGGTNTWMAIDGENLSINTSTNAVSTNILWQSSSGIGAAVSNLGNTVSQHTTQIAALQARPDLTSWGNYAPDGTANPDAANTLMLNKPTTVMASGFSWATSGAFACLCQSGAVAFMTETAGEIRIGTDATTNYFGLVQGGSVTVGCRTDGFRVADGVAHITYAYAGGAFPTIWFSASLSPVAWTECTAPVWVDNGDGTATASLPATGARGFFTAFSTRDISARFRSNVPAELAGGVYGSIAQEPVKYDSTITVTSGGHTYRIPAQLVQ